VILEGDFVGRDLRWETTSTRRCTTCLLGLTRVWKLSLVMVLIHQVYLSNSEFLQVVPSKLKVEVE